MLHAITYINLENLMLSEISQTQKNYDSTYSKTLKETNS